MYIHIYIERERARNKSIVCGNRLFATFPVPKKHSIVVYVQYILLPTASAQAHKWILLSFFHSFPTPPPSPSQSMQTEEPVVRAHRGRQQGHLHIHVDMYRYLCVCVCARARVFIYDNECLGFRVRVYMIMSVSLSHICMWVHTHT